MLLNRYKSDSCDLGPLRRRNRNVILFILIGLSILVWGMVWKDYRDRKAAEGPMIHELVEQGETWTIIDDETPPESPASP